MAEAAERMTWVAEYGRTRNAAAVCARLGISRPTLRKWWARYEVHGAEGLQNRSRAPHASPSRKVTVADAAAIRALRADGQSLANIQAALGVRGLHVSVPTIRRALDARPRRAGAAMAPARPGQGLFGTIMPDDPLFRALATRITGGDLRPGEHLAEDALARHHRMSRLRVRAALQVLAMIGLVRMEGRSAIIEAPSAQTVADAYAARRLVEGGIVRALAVQATEADIAVLRQHIRRQADAERRGDKVSLVRLLTDFHLLLAAMAGNPFLRGFIETLASTTSLAVLLYDQASVSSCAVDEHRHLVRLLEQGDGEKAAAVMEDHLGRNHARQSDGS